MSRNLGRGSCESALSPASGVRNQSKVVQYSVREGGFEL